MLFPSRAHACVPLYPFYPLFVCCFRSFLVLWFRILFSLVHLLQSLVNMELNVKITVLGDVKPFISQHGKSKDINKRRTDSDK